MSKVAGFLDNKSFRLNILSNKIRILRLLLIFESVSNKFKFAISIMVIFFLNEY